MQDSRFPEKLRLWSGLMAESGEFREALRRIGRSGLIAAGGIGILATLTFLVSKAVLVGQTVGWNWWVASPSSSQILVADKAVIVLLSLGLIAAGWRRWSLPAGRLLMAAAALLAAGTSLTADLARGGFSVNYVTFLFVVAVAAMPYRPWQTALLGVGFSGLLYVTGEYGPLLIPGAPSDVSVPTGGQFVHVSVITVLMVGVSALLYASRHQQYRARRREEKLREEVADLEATKSRFFANVSHELRTPLTVILGPLEDALDGQYGDLPDRLRDRLGAMKDQAKRLHTLVDQLLRLSKLDEGRMDLHARLVDLVPFLRRMKSFFRSMADRQGVEVRIDTEGDPVACADPEALKQIVSNLLSNALEHTPEDGTVRIRTGRADGDGGRVAVSVRDSGPGLPEEVRDALFDRYVGAETEDTGAIGVSTGIGLALVKELSERHGGSVTAESEPGFGTEITVTLPANCAALPDEDVASNAVDGGPEPAVEPELDRTSVAAGASQPGNGETEGQAVLAGPSDDRPTVLVVDDEASVRSYLQDVLTPRYAVQTAADGEEGLEAARENRPDLVISDVVMPKRDGYGLCRALRADDRLRGVPIVLLTVQDEQEHRLEGFRKGADAYVGKPFHPEELRQRVENLIGIRQYLQSRSRQASASAEPGANQAEDKSEKEEGSEPALGKESEFLQEARATVEEHVGNSSFGVEWLADEVGLSTRQLQRRLQEEVGLSAAAYIRATRLERAAELLEQGTVTTVTDAASAVGYRDASYFSQLFKEAHGQPPSALKE